MSIWELTQCIDGYNKANGAEEAAVAPSWAEHQARVLRLATA